MIKDDLKEVCDDLKAKRDALSCAHQKLKNDSDDWNKGIIVLSLTTGMLESIKMKLDLTGAGWALIPILLSSVIAACSALIKFRNFPQRMETIINASGLITNILGKARNHKEMDEDLRAEYNDALTHLETSLYPDQRRTFLRQSHKNLISIMKQEQQYVDLIIAVNKHEPADFSPPISEEDLLRDELDERVYSKPAERLPVVDEREAL